MENPLVQLSATISEIVATAARSVATVHARPRVTASGVIWDEGTIVTADNAIARDEDIHVTLPDGTRTSAALAGRDSATGIAVLSYTGGGEPISIPESPDVRQPGELLIAVGRNADTGPTASLGILSAAGGPWRTWRGGQLDQFLRLDMSLYPGSTGGIVVDARGTFAGIASDGLSRLSPLAIPISTLTRVVGELRTKGRVARGFLGVALQSVKLPDGEGVILLSVEADAGAGQAGLLVGDVLISLNGEAVAHPEDVQAFLSSHAPGDVVTARIVRGGQNIEKDVRLGDRSK